MTLESDPVVCVACDDPDSGDELLATPAGPLCRDHAQRLQERTR